MKKLASLLLLALLAAGCGSNTSKKFASLSDDFVYGSLALSPGAATGVGLHTYNGQKLDGLLDDVSPAGIDRQRRFYRDFQTRLDGIRPDSLAAEERADRKIIEDQIGLALLELDQIQSYKHNPTVYVEAYGNAMFSPFVLEYAPLPERIASIIARLRETPRYLEQVKANLISAPEIWNTVAIEENEGNVNLVSQTIRKAVPRELVGDYDAALAPAMDALLKFHQFLIQTLSQRKDADWRLGHDRYARKFRYVLETGTEPQALLRQAETDLTQIRGRMLDLALPLHRRDFPSHKDHAELSGDERQDRIIGEALDRIAQRHSTPASYLDDARAGLEETRAFVIDRKLLTLPPTAAGASNLKVIPTPEFMRGVYSVGGFNSAPALEPQLGAFYWVTPVPGDWPKERIESKLREYNFFGLKLLTIHEAMPGHYVQFEFANGVEPKGRRVLRSVFGNGPYVEGWAVYASQMMLDEGYLEHSPEMALSFAKHELRVLANAIIDIKLQSGEMTDAQALDLMIGRTFQEREEAAGKLQRAKLTSCQLPVYYAGFRGWLDTRDAYRKAKGSAFSLPAFHNRALQEGAVPLSSLGALIQ
jgi:uncharacterized protein (DUF885 family)